MIVINTVYVVIVSLVLAPDVGYNYYLRFATFVLYFESIQYIRNISYLFREANL